MKSFKEFLAEAYHKRQNASLVARKKRAEREKADQEFLERNKHRLASSRLPASGRNPRTGTNKTLAEAPESGVMASELDHGDIKPAGRYDHEDWVGTHGDYNIQARSWKSPHSKSIGRPHHYLAISPDDEVHFSTRGGNTKDGYFISNETRKHPDAELTAPEFYKSILHSDRAPKGIQSGSAHSEGGKSIWHRLSKDPELIVTHHRKSDGKQIKLHTGDAEEWEKNYDHPEPTYFRARLK